MAKIESSYDEATDHGALRRYLDGGVEDQVAERVAAKQAAALVTEQEWKTAVAAAAPTRPDDTVVVSGGKRATLEEFQAYVAEDLVRRAVVEAHDL